MSVRQSQAFRREHKQRLSAEGEAQDTSHRYQSTALSRKPGPTGSSIPKVD
jgi:hypothetical protein